MEHGPLVEALPFIKGLLCGSMVIGSLAVPNGILVQLALFLIAALVFLDALFMFGREIHLLSFLLSLMAGLILGIVFALSGLIGPLMVVAFVVMAMVYLYEFMGHREARKERPEPGAKEH
jgi:hypothetical protein